MPLVSNYGGILQNYALQVVLQRLGHNPVTLRFPSMYQNRSVISSIQLYLNLLGRYYIKRILRRNAVRPLSPSKWKKNTASFESFINKYINCSEYVQNISVEICNQYEIDALIVGSDQIWRPEVPFVIERYFCRFASNSNIPRVSYAASLALDRWTFQPNQTSEIRNLLTHFSHVSVREQSGISLLKENVNCEAEWVVDPTMLLKKEDYLKLIENIPQRKDKFVFAYILDNNNDKESAIIQYAQTNMLKVYYLNDIASDSSASIERWLSLFRDCEIVITDSFHGTVFSILFEKQFMCFENPHRGNARMNSLKVLTGLEERFVKNFNEFKLTDINYKIINEKIDIKRRSSWSFLQKSLG